MDIVWPKNLTILQKSFLGKKVQMKLLNFYMQLKKTKILIISQYFWPNNFRINDIISNFSDKKYKKRKTI